MSWGIAAAWAIVAGSMFLTAGTGAQAWASLAEYRDLLQIAPPSAQQALQRLFLPLLPWTVYIAGQPGVFTKASLGKSTWWFFRATLPATWAIPRRITAIRQAGSEEALRLAQALRQTAVWSILMAGSVLVLTGAVIQLALGYAT